MVDATMFGQANFLDEFLHRLLRVNQFIRESNVYHKANTDDDNGLKQMDVYAFLNYWCRKKITNHSEEFSQVVWSQLEEILEAVDKGGVEGLCLKNCLHTEYMDWCQSTSAKECPETSEFESKSPRKRSASFGDSAPIKKQTISVAEKSVANDDKLETDVASRSQSSPTCNESSSEVEITEEDHIRAMKLLRGLMGPVIANKFNLRLGLADIRTLFGTNWLNDNVINFYMELLNERSKQNAGQLPSVHAMNTYFIPRLLGDGYWSVRRWTRKVDLFSKEIIPVPVHFSGHPNHWSMAIIDMRDKTIRYYDSLGRSNLPVLVALKSYLQQESLDKRHQPLDTNSFKIEHVEKVPRQLNGYDCGVFCCMFAEYVTRNAPLTFSQQHMMNMRKKMILEIADGKLWT